jgi:hypothetical protein
VRACVSAGEALPADMFRRWKEKTGTVILDGIGSTECLHIFVGNSLADHRPGTSGKPVPGYEVNILDDAGKPVPKGESGRLWIRSESAAKYYWNKPEKTAETMVDGWLNTGDTYRQDADGYFIYEGRSDDMLKVGGIWCSPVEIENCLIGHASVLEVAVVGHADADTLIKPKAIVVLKQPGIYEDDQQKPDVGKQKTEKLVQSDQVDFIAGYIWSNVLLASLKTAVDSQTFLISANAGPSQLAGDLCSPYVFSTSWQNDQTPAAMGLYMNQKGVKSVFLIGPNYAAGKDMLAGVKSTFKGEVKGEEYTVWPSQLDFSAELSKAKASGAESIFVFYPGAAGVQFLNQYAQAGSRRRSRSIRLSPSTNCRCRCRRTMRSAFPARRNGSTICRTSRTSVRRRLPQEISRPAPDLLRRASL